MLIGGGKETNLQTSILDAIRVHAFRHNLWLEPSHVIHHRKGGAMKFFLKAPAIIIFILGILFLTACPEQRYRAIHWRERTMFDCPGTGCCNMQLPLTCVHFMHWDYVARSSVTGEPRRTRTHLLLLTSIKTRPEVCYQKTVCAQACETPALSINTKFET